ncbi:MAG: tetratricopeptide repeat protein, partial [Myxococcales bacterium]|nr:tetratricopeptide repeat protein [Myxococcales bacterium]
PWSEDAAPPEASPQLLGPDRLRLPPGRWSVETEAGRRAEVVLPDRTLELHGAHIHVEVAGDVARVEVLRGEVTEHHAADPARLEAPAEPAESRRAPLDADALAREAEVHLAAGRRGEAIKSLRRLVTRFPRSAAAQAGLIDLGRLLEREGQADRARCAYALFLERWPSHSLRGDVASAQRALGPGPACDGLRPER